MPLQLVPATDEEIRAAPARDHQIVGDETMASLDQVEHALRLADAALPHEQQPDAVHVGQGTVQIRRRRELVFEPRLEPRVELIGLEPRADDGNPRRRGEFDQILPRPLPLRDEHAGHRVRKNVARCLRRTSGSIDLR